MTKGHRRGLNHARFFSILKYSSLVLGAILLWVFAPYYIGSSDWDGSRRFTLVVQNIQSEDKESPVGVFSIEPNEKKAVYLLLYPNTLLDVPFGYKTYPARSVYSLGTLDKTHKAGDILAKAVQSTLGIYVDGYMVFKKSSLILPTTSEELEKYKRDNFSIFASVKHLSADSIRGLDTNLSLPDRRKLFFAIQSLRSDQVKFVDLASSFITSEDKWPDGSAIRDIDRDRFEVLVAGAFQDSQIRGENMAVEVVNGAGVEKLATSMSRIFEHLGANVIFISTAKENQKASCTMILSDKSFNKKQTVVRFTDLFNCEKEYKIDEGLSGDIKIILGENFVK